MLKYRHEGGGDMAYEKRYIFDPANNGDCWGTIANLFEDCGENHPKCNSEEAKAFLIGLVFDAVGVSADSDIALVSFNLLSGYETIQGQILRRKKYAIAANYQGASSKIECPSVELSEDELNKAAENVKTREDKIYARIYRYFDEIENKPVYFSKKVKEHLSAARDANGVYSAILPKPTYLEQLALPSQTNIGIIGTSVYRKQIIADIAEYFFPESFEPGMRLLVLYGMPGVGKTYIATQYVRQHYGDYERAFLLNAGTEAEIQHSCYEFLKDLNPAYAKLAPDEHRRIFLNYFNHHGKWLLIFDGVDFLDLKSSGHDGTAMVDVFKSYLPTNSASCGHILITSCCDVDYLGAERIRVDVFSPETAISYLNELTGLSDQDEDARILSEELGCLPLALRYAGAYISENRKRSYAKYLQLYRKETKALLEDNLDSVGQMSVAATFKLARNKYEADTGDEKKDQLMRAALQFMNICAYTAPDNISLIPYAEDTKNLPEPLRTVLKNELLRDKLIYHLTKYSLMDYNPETETFSMHRLLQTVIRIQEEKNKSELVAYSYHALIKQYNLYKLGGTPERANLVRSLAPHLQTVMPYIVAAGIDQSENLRVAEEYCTHNENLRIKTSYNDLGDFLDNMEEECKIYEEELEYLKSVGLGKSHLVAIRLLLLGERLQILHNDETWIDPYFEAFDLSEELIDGFQPGERFGKDDTWYLQALFVFTSCVRFCVDYLDPANIMGYYRHIIKAIDKMSTVTYVDDSQEYYNSLSSIFQTSVQMLAELSGKAVHGIVRIPYYYLADGSPDPSYPDGCRAIVSPTGSPWVHNFPYTVIEGRKLRTYGFSTREEYARPATINSELAKEFDFIAESYDEAIQNILKIESKDTCDISGFVMALPDDCLVADGFMKFQKKLYSAICQKNGRDYSEIEFTSYLDESRQAATAYAEAFHHFLEPSPAMRKMELAEMQKMLDEIVSTMEVQILPISYAQFEDRTGKAPE